MITVPDIIIAVDGWSSTGKSTFAKLVAKHFGFLYLDSGAMYRGVTLLAMEKGLIGPEGIDEPGLKASLDEGFDLHFERPGDGSTRLFSGERDIEKEIRTMEVSSYVSPISAVAFVRSWVDERLHAFSVKGREPGLARDHDSTMIRARSRFSTWVKGSDASPFRCVAMRTVAK